MKTILYLLFVMPFFCFSQTENRQTPKPATDDCPSWNKKNKSSSKAEYFQFLRSGKSKNQQQAAVYYPNAQRIAPGTQTQSQGTTEPNPFFIPKKERRNPPQTLPRRENTPTVLKEEETEEPKPVEVTKSKEEPIIASTNANEGKNAEPALKEKEVSTDSKTIVKDKPKTENTFKKWFHHASTKKTKACKSGGASKCPSF